MKRLGRDALVARLAQEIGEERRLVAIAGPPAAGKSTVVAWLAERLGERTMALGMDGFHLDDSLLEARGWRARKGAPHTFDAAGLRALLERLRRDDEDEVLAPEFDRSLEISRAGALAIPRSARLLLVEGNYLLLRQPPWDGLRRLFDLTVFIDADEALLRRRLEQRWRVHGRPEAEARAWIETNDLPNIRLVLAESAEADIVMDAE